MDERTRASANRGGWRLPFGGYADRRLIILSAIIAAFYGLGMLGLALLPVLTRDQPLLLLLLNPTTTVLLLVSARIDPVTLVVLTVARRFLVHIVFFLLGWWYAEGAVRWMVGRGAETEQIMGLTERIFRRVGWLAIVLWPGPLPSVLAGAGRMRWPMFVALDLVGSVASVLLTRYAASVAANPLALLLHFIDEHAEILTIIFASMVALWLASRWLWGRANRAADLPAGE